jgi:hypothetical protein
MKSKAICSVNDGVVSSHRVTNVKMEGNNIYKIHDELSKKYGVDKLAQMGGLECGKCHY